MQGRHTAGFWNAWSMNAKPDQWARYADERSFAGVFTPAECGRIIAEHGAAKAWTSEMEIDGRQYRSTDLIFLPRNEGTEWLYARVERPTRAWNADFGFVIESCSLLQLARYRSGQGYEWHADLGSKDYSLRKLTTVVMLSAPDSYAGGRLEFFKSDDIRQSFPLKAGDAVVFPAWVKHRVTAVTEGERWTLSAWWLGPPFR
jgi:PKHD-type hydroxylase